MTVPDGYFDDFARRMAAQLPEQPWECQTPVGTVVKPSRRFWQTVRPYVYMAAMFLGIWCMMNMFDHIVPSRTDLSIDSNPVLTAAVSNDSFMNDYFIDGIDENELYEEMYDSGVVATDYTSDSTSGSVDSLI